MQSLKYQNLWLQYYTDEIKHIVYGRGICLSWLVGLVNDNPDSMLYLTSFLVLHNITCGYVCIHSE